MLIEHHKITFVHRIPRCSCALLAAITVPQVNLGCIECILPSDLIDQLPVRGRLVGEGTSDGLAEAAVGGQLITRGEVTTTTSALKLDGAPNVRLTGEDGTFVVGFIVGATGCASPLGPRLPPPEILPPDEVVIIVVNGGCEDRFSFAVNAENFVDPTAPDDVLELKEPILVPPCSPSP